jgi:hypothetical protein
VAALLQQLMMMMVVMVMVLRASAGLQRLESKLRRRSITATT